MSRVQNLDKRCSVYEKISQVDREQVVKYQTLLQNFENLYFTEFEKMSFS